MNSPLLITVYSSSEDMSNICVKLPFNLQFPTTECWKVALTEISFPASFVNVKDDYLVIQDERHTYRIEVPDGFYQQVRDVYRALKWLWREYRIPGRFAIPRYFSKSGRLKLTIRPFQSIILSKNLAGLLQVPTRNENVRLDNLVIESSSKLENAIENECIWISTDFVEERMIGNQAVTLLTTLTIEQNYPWGSSTHTPQFLEYLSVKPGIYTSIRINIRKEGGEEFKCLSNYVLVKLKFTRV